MRIVIDIPENVYKYLKQEWVKVPEDDSVINQIMHGILHGTVLPKGHGALIDEHNLLDKWNNLSVRGRTEFDQVIMCTPVVISADEGD